MSCAIVLPGSGSDEIFVRAAFGPAAAALGVDLLAPVPRPGPGVVDGALAALDAALDRPGRLLVGGVSLGAHIAARWTAAAPAGRVAGLLLALPAWTGPPGDAPAALTARAGAAQVRADGTAAALATARAGAPRWLADELDRAWPRYGDELAASLEAAATECGPTEEELAGLDLPVGIAAAVDDPVHPVEVARRWARALPRAAVATVGLAQVGADPAVLGHAAVEAWLEA